LKFELILTESFHGGGCNHQVPGRGEDFGIPERLPELDVELAIILAAADEPFHDDALFHPSIIFRSAPRAAIPQ
jgi:hypothetical protein